VSNTVLRVLTALAAAPLVVGIAYWGGWAFGLLVAAIALAAQFELYTLAEDAGLHPQKTWGAVLGGLLVLQPLWPAAGPMVLLIGTVLVALLPFVFRRDTLLGSLAVTVLGAFYPAALLSFLVRLRVARGAEVGDSEAFYLVLLTLLLVWASDIFAYYVGRAVGRHALAPNISPNKTWEGALGGLLAAIGIAVAFKLTLGPFLAWGHLAVLVVIGGVIGPFGDLAESQLKRASGADDSSTLLPGHGGFLDRFDAMAITAPLVYLYLVHVARLIG
jgi:phosphatidate cytidylyltransferase